MKKYFVTDVISRDYEESTDKQRKEILKLISKIYPKKDDLECILLNLGSEFRGNSKIDQTTLFLLGDGSSGKNTIMLLTQSAFECYSKELKN